jgi:hypothetical protein
VSNKADQPQPSKSITKKRQLSPVRPSTRKAPITQRPMSTRASSLATGSGATSQIRTSRNVRRNVGDSGPAASKIAIATTKPRVERATTSKSSVPYKSNTSSRPTTTPTSRTSSTSKKCDPVATTNIASRPVPGARTTRSSAAQLKEKPRNDDVVLICPKMDVAGEVEDFRFDV